MAKNFEALAWFTGFENLALGVTIDWARPNVQIHVPFFFIKIGWEAGPLVGVVEGWGWSFRRKFGVGFGFCNKGTHRINEQLLAGAVDPFSMVEE